ncbi:hypothetical protein [Cryobacterium psychrophilum]|uniref:Uncharacterized protein n=1 Tax=Cryobacterium psychrophilum TaxID=41988 RepID=A0A4Y8KSJ5_9MICO|nr:hypothetical protein [Cryobacterium psychrophilum]TDW29724.1 hypothetical protein EDD25_1434 [Cryobacterium psychrophilum]TFD81831.1 hypothetical protein E3T53_02240 [Cryobacterium psychrophilum]
MSDITSNDGKKNPETDAATPVEHEATETGGASTAAASTTADSEPGDIDYAAATEEPESVNGTGSHAAAPSLADDYAARDHARTNDDTEVVTPVVAASAASEPVAPVASPTPVPVADPTPVAPLAAQTPIYVQAPQKPVDRSNRGGGIFIALIATAIFTVLYAVAIFVIAGFTSATISVAATTFTEFAVRPVFYIPVIFFFLALSILVAIVNRGGWWAYVLFGFVVAVVVYFSYIGAALLTVQAWTLTADEAARFLSTQWLNLGAITAAVIAREVPVWTGAWIAQRGKRVTKRNLEARAEYERVLADGPHLSN